MARLKIREGEKKKKKLNFSLSLPSHDRSCQRGSREDLMKVELRTQTPGLWEKKKGQASALDKGSGRDQKRRNPFCGLYHIIPCFTDTFLYQWKSLGFQDQEAGLRRSGRRPRATDDDEESPLSLPLSKVEKAMATKKMHSLRSCINNFRFARDLTLTAPLKARQCVFSSSPYIAWYRERGRRKAFTVSLDWMPRFFSVSVRCTIWRISEPPNLFALTWARFGSLRATLRPIICFFTLKIGPKLGKVWSSRNVRGSRAFLPFDSADVPLGLKELRVDTGTDSGTHGYDNGPMRTWLSQAQAADGKETEGPGITAELGGYFMVIVRRERTARLVLLRVSDFSRTLTRGYMEICLHMAWPSLRTRSTCTLNARAHNPGTCLQNSQNCKARYDSRLGTVTVHLSRGLPINLVTSATISRANVWDPGIDVQPIIRIRQRLGPALQTFLLPFSFVVVISGKQSAPTLDNFTFRRGGVFIPNSDELGLDREKSGATAVVAVAHGPWFLCFSMKRRFLCRNAECLAKVYPAWERIPEKGKVNGKYVVESTPYLRYLTYGRREMDDALYSFPCFQCLCLNLEGTPKYPRCLIASGSRFALEEHLPFDSQARCTLHLVALLGHRRAAACPEGREGKEGAQPVG
ncbi:hypothetical protein CCUS01_11041 [Colletotrichum cuscutae]|uniref:Uncharacterized protein n=1 Tax=Colletotrichum cuscutae TaxID=1209917 RepID=A0AAI9U3Y6_9PEZI|nr:hypothetical protein CCUS01_11041 [Colletotrichum cuscutae]